MDGNFYEVTLEEGEKIEAKCLECQRVIKGNNRSTGNFLSHYRTQHEAMMGKLQAHLDKKNDQESEGSVTQRTVAVVGPAISKVQVK